MLTLIYSWGLTFREGRLYLINACGSHGSINWKYTTRIVDVFSSSAAFPVLFLFSQKERKTIPHWDPFIYVTKCSCMSKGHFTHETESPWPIHFKHPQGWKRRSRSKFASHYAWGTNGVCECKMDVKYTWIPTWHQMDHVSWSFGLFLKDALHPQKMKSGDHYTPNPHKYWFFYFIMCEDMHEQTFTRIAFGWGPGHIWLPTTLEDLWPYYIILEVGSRLRAPH